MGLIIDSREPPKMRNFFKAKGIEHMQKVLMTGDYLCFNDEEPEVQVLIERKRLDDLLSSFYSHRMGEQFERLSHEKFAILIITGSMEEATKNVPFRVMTQLVEEVISQAVIQYNFRSVIWMIDKVQDVHQNGFLTMVKIIQKVVDGQMDSIPQKKVKLSKDLRVNTLRQLFGLDASTSKNLLRKYGTVRKVLSLTDIDLLKVKGVGPAKMKTIRYILDESIHKENYKKSVTNDICPKCGNKLTMMKLGGGNTLMCMKCVGSLS